MLFRSAWMQVAGGRPLRWTLVTTHTQRVHAGEAVHPAHAAVAGFAGALAKEQPQWDITLVDLAADADASAWQQLLRLPADAQGHGWAWRAGHWYRPTLLPAEVSGPAAPPMRRGQDLRPP